MKGEVAVVGAITTKNVFGGELVARWLRYSAVGEKSSATYLAALKQLGKYFSDNNISTPKREDIENWRETLKAAGKSPSTVQLYLSTAKRFFSWLASEKVFDNIADNVKSGVRINHDHKREALTANQARLLFQAVRGTGLKAKRDRAILALMMSAGLRTIEVERANVGDLIKVGDACYLLVQGKGHSAKDARVRVAPQVESLIRDYLSNRPDADGAAPLFTSTSRSNKGAGITTQTVRKMVKHYLREIGLDDPRYSAHSIRHTAATTMLLNGASLEQVQQVMRHTSLSTTMIYNHSIERMKNNAELLAANAIFGA